MSGVDLEADQALASVMRELRDVRQALAVFAEKFDAQLAFDISPSLNCTEVEALCAVLELTDATGSQIDAWRSEHAQSDDEGDMHDKDGRIRLDHSAMEDHDDDAIGR